MLQFASTNCMLRGRLEPWQYSSNMATILISCNSSNTRRTEFKKKFKFSERFAHQLMIYCQIQG